MSETQPPEGSLSSHLRWSVIESEWDGVIEAETSRETNTQRKKQRNSDREMLTRLSFDVNPKQYMNHFVQKMLKYEQLVYSMQLL